MNDPPHPRDMMTPEDAADLLGLSASTLSKWRSTGSVLLPYVKFGRTIRYRRSDVEAFLATQTVNQPSEDHNIS